MIILNWNTTDILYELYDSIRRLTFIVDNQVIIYDNGSRKEEFDKFQKFKFQEKNFILTRNETNIGFSAGNNVASGYVNENALAVFFINSDILIKEEDWDLKFMTAFTDEKVGIVGCAYHPLKWDKNGNFHIQQIPKEPVESESVQGAFFAIRGELFRKLLKQDGYIFDENFKYAHYEETDLCFRVRKMGYKIMWIPVNHEHRHNQSSTKQNGYCLNDEIKNIDDFRKNSERNKQLLVKKHSDIL